MNLSRGRVYKWPAKDWCWKRNRLESSEAVKQEECESRKAKMCSIKRVS